VSFGS
jgi:hypothetical protein